MMRFLEWSPALLLVSVVLAGLVAEGADARQRGQGPQTPRTLVLVDRAGSQTVLGEVPFNTNGPRVSPDGTQLAFGVDGLYVGPLMNPAAMRRIGPGRFPLWSHDATRMFFEAPMGEVMLWRRLGVEDEGEQLVTPARAPESRSPDGRYMSYVQSVDNQFSGWTLDLMTRQPTQIPDSGPEALGTNFSPDGRWIAYQSTKSGRYEIYVQPFGRPGPAVQVTTIGAFRPLWSADMREMYFDNVDNGQRQLWVVPIRIEPAFAVAGEPQRLPITGFVQAGVGRRMYDLLPDGRFVMMLP